MIPKGIKLQPQFKSHLSQVRGLKYKIHSASLAGSGVAPFTGAWIEISLQPSHSSRLSKSHLSQVRGLKCGRPAQEQETKGRRTFHRCVDWNRYRPIVIGDLPWVAPFTGAWIEILIQKLISLRTIVAPFTGAWIEMFRRLVIHFERMSHLSQVRGLKWV